MSTLQGAVRYRCSCGAEYLVALDHPGDDVWFGKVSEAAASLGVEAIDGSASRFVCTHCGRAHVRTGVELPDDEPADKPDYVRAGIRPAG